MALSQKRRYFLGRTCAVLAYQLSTYEIKSLLAWHSPSQHVYTGQMFL